MDNKIIWKFVIGSVILMILIPIITNYLMFVGDFKVAGDNKTWIGYLGSFWGAIIGGIISGALTLIGVNITIKSQLNKEFQENMPQQLMNLEDIILFVDKQNALVIRVLETDSSSLLRQRMKYTFEGLSEDGLLKKSASVNLHTYSTVRKLNDFLYNSLYPNNVSIYTESEVKEVYKTCIDVLNLEHKKIIKEIEIYEGKRKWELINFSAFYLQVNLSFSSIKTTKGGDCFGI